MKERTITIISILLILTAQIAKSKIQKKGDFPEMTLLQTKEPYNMELRFPKTVDMSHLKYPLSIESTMGEGKTYKTEIFKNDISESNLQKVAFSKVMDKDIILSTSAVTPTIHVRIVQGLSGFDGKSLTFTPQFSNTKRHDFICEDAVFLEKTRRFYVGCRAPFISEEVKSAVALVSLEFDQDNQLKLGFTLDVFENDGYVIHNRVKLEVIEDAEKETLILLHDQFVNNGVDHEIEKKVRPFRVLGNAFDTEKVIELKDDQNQLSSLVDFTVFREHLLAVGKRSDKGDSLCFTSLDLDQSETQMLVRKEFQCTDVKADGYAGFTETSNLITYNAKSREFQIQRVNKDFTAENWIVELLDEFELGMTQMAGGVRSAHEGDGVFVASFSPSKGVADAGNALMVSTSLALAWKMEEKETCVVFNRILVRTSDTQEAFHRIEAPFFNLDVSKLAVGKNDIEIKIYDSEMTQEEAISIKGVANLVDKPFGKIETGDSSTIIQVYPGLRIKHPFNLNMIKAGNQVKTELESPETVKGIVTTSMNTRLHSARFTPELPEGAEIRHLSMTTGAAFLENSKTGDIHWYQCFEESELQTECHQVAKTKTYSKPLQNISGAVFEIAYTVQYDEKSDSSYFSWLQYDDGWQYELYNGRIIDANHVVSSNGKVFLVLVFEDHIKVSVFFDNWYYGSRNMKTFYHYDVDGYEFCPVQVIIDSEERSRVFALSNCNDEQEIFEFEIDQNGENVNYIRSRDIGTQIKSPEMCVIGSEILLYSTVAHELYSLEKFESSTKAKIDIELFGIDNIQDFECYPEKNLFNILTKKRSKKESNGDNQQAQETMEVLVLRGGRFLDGYNRVLTRITGLSTKFTRLEAFNHRNDFVLVLWDEENKSELHRVYLNEPLLFTQFEENQFTQTEEFEIKIKLSNPDLTEYHGIHKITPIALPKREILKPEAKLKYSKSTTHDISTTVLSTGNVLEISSNTQSTLRNLVEENLGQIPKVQAFSFKEGDTSYPIDHREVGRFQRLKSYDIISTYTENSPLHYGFIELHDSTSRKKIDSFYSVNSFKKVDSVQVDDHILSAVLMNNGRKVDLAFIFTTKGKFNHKVETVIERTLFDDVKLFEVSKTNGRIIMGLIAHSKSLGLVKLYKVILIPDEEDWEISVAEFDALDEKVMTFSIAIRPKFVGFYYIKLENQGIDRKLIDKANFKFTPVNSQELKALNQQPPKVTVKYDNIACEEFGPDNAERCVMSSYGADLTFVQYGYPEQSNDAQDPIPQFLTYKLVRYGEYYGQNLAISGRFVMQESDLFLESQEKKLLIWDLEITKKNNDRGVDPKIQSVTTVIDMKHRDSKDTMDSKLLFVGKNSNGIIEAFMQVEDRPTDQIYVVSKEIHPWSVTFDGSDYDVVKDYGVKVNQGNDESVTLKISDIFEQA